MYWDQTTYYSYTNKTGSSYKVEGFQKRSNTLETFISQRINDWQTRYTFSGKEKDRMTGFSYFGARYYDSETSVWLSVDGYTGHIEPNKTPVIFRPKTNKNLFHFCPIVCFNGQLEPFYH